MEQEKQRELFFRLSMFEQQIQNIQQQIEAVEKGINELGELNFGLDEISGGKGKEVLAPLGRGIFVKTELKSPDLIVDIGGQNFVKKSVKDTKEIIDEQIKKLIKIKEDLNNTLEGIGEEMTKTINEAQE